MVEAQKTVTQMVESRRGSSLLFVLSIFVFFIMVGFSIFLNLQKTALSEEQDRIRIEISGLNNEILSLQAQNLEGASIAQDWLSEIKNQEIRWSSVIDEIWTLLPKDEKTAASIVKILSYNGAQGGKINLSVETNGERVGTFANVAKLIAAFNANPRFDKALVPSISRGEDDLGNIVLSFGLNVNYAVEKISAVTSQSSTQAVQQGESGGVSRVQP
jgi:hypothetical protein